MHLFLSVFYVSECFAYMYVHVWYPQRSEEGTRPPGTSGTKDGCEPLFVWVLGIKLESSGEATSALNIEPSLQPLKTS